MKYVKVKRIEFKEENSYERRCEPFFSNIRKSIKSDNEKLIFVNYSPDVYEIPSILIIHLNYRRRIILYNLRYTLKLNEVNVMTELKMNNLNV